MLTDLSLLILVLGTAEFRGSLRQDQASYDVMAEYSKWLEAGEESIFSLQTEKKLSGASYALPEAAARIKKFPEIKFLRQLVEFRSGRSSS